MIRKPASFLLLLLFLSLILIVSLSQAQGPLLDPDAYLPLIQAGDVDGQPGDPVTPYAVKGDPALLQIPSTTEIVTAPEEAGGPTQAPPEPSPIFDPVVQLTAFELAADGESAAGIDELSGPLVNFPGTTAPNNPPDTVGDVGPNHYVQMNNGGVLANGAFIGTAYEIWNKDGTSPPNGGPFRFGALWPAGDPCNSNRGDPIVVYDHLADRWLLSQFARNAARTQFWECVAISQTPDPTDNLWYLYTFGGIPNFPDYPKFGVWPDGYYMSSWEAPNQGIYVFDRVNMLNGNAAGYLRDDLPGLGTSSVRGTRILPADLDGPPPDPGTPNYFVRTVDDQQDPGTNDRIEIYEAAVDWVAGTFTISSPPETLTPAPFQIMICNRNGLPPPGPGQRDPRIRDCIPQPDETDTVDTLSNRPMMQLKYRNFGSYEAMVFNQTIDISGSITATLDITPTGELAGIRWYELRKSGANWTIEQQGTFAPQPRDATAEDQLINRWMASAAMDKYGNIALGYTAANSDDTNGEEIYPSIWYTGRTAGDLAGFMAQGEKVILNGVISQGNGDANIDPQRWGDYSAMSVDPVDDCTFWYTNHVAGLGGNGARPTQIASFRFADCGTDMSISKSDTPDPVYAGQLLRYGITVRNNGPNLAFDVVVTDTLPSGVSYVSNNDDCSEGPVGTLVCNVGDLAVGASSSFDILVEVDADLVAVSGGVPTLLNTTEVSSDRSDPNESNNVARATTFVYELADLQAFKECKPDIPMPAGATGICYITIENLGPSTAREVTVEDVHVSNKAFTIGSVSTSAGACAVTPNPQNGSGTVDCDLGDVDPGQVVTIQVPITADTAQNINDRATVRSDTPDPVWSNNVANDGLSFIDAADLAISKVAEPSTVIAGTRLTYTLTITNHGPSTASNVVVEDVLPVGVAIQTIQASAGSCNAGVPGNAGLPSTCTFDSLAPGASESMQIVVLVDATMLGSLGNNGRVFSDTYDPNNANNLATVATIVDASADLQVQKSDVTDPVAAGDPLRYEIVVFNAGPSRAVDVSLTDILPAEVTYVGYDISGGAGGTCALAAGPPISVGCELNDLLPGQSVTVGIDTIVDPSVPNGTVIVNQVTVSSATADPNPSNNTDTEETRVWAEADLAVGKDASFLTENPAPRILYTLTVANGGPSDAQDVVLVDTLPLDPQKIVYVMDSGNGACLYDELSHTVTCDLGTVAAGEVVIIEIIVDARGSVGRITNVADVSSTTMDNDLSNNHVEKEIRVKGGPGTG